MAAAATSGTTTTSTLGLALGSLVGAVGLSMIVFEAEPIRRYMERSPLLRRVESLVHGMLGSIATSGILQLAA